MNFKSRTTVIVEVEEGEVLDVYTDQLESDVKAYVVNIDSGNDDYPAQVLLQKRISDFHGNNVTKSILSTEPYWILDDAPICRCRNRIIDQDDQVFDFIEVFSDPASGFGIYKASFSFQDWDEKLLFQFARDKGIANVSASRIDEVNPWNLGTAVYLDMLAKHPDKYIVPDKHFDDVESAKRYVESVVDCLIDVRLSKKTLPYTLDVQQMLSAMTMPQLILFVHRYDTHVKSQAPDSDLPGIGEFIAQDGNDLPPNEDEMASTKHTKVRYWNREFLIPAICLFDAKLRAYQAMGIPVECRLLTAFLLDFMNYDWSAFE